MMLSGQALAMTSGQWIVLTGGGPKLDAAHLSRVENGRRPPTARIAAALDGVFTEHRGWYLTWLEETRTAPEIPVTFRSWSDYEDRTAALRVWTPGIVDGLVQAQAYAAALIATSPGVSDDAAAARLNARMEGSAASWAATSRLP